MAISAVRSRALVDHPACAIGIHWPTHVSIATAVCYLYLPACRPMVAFLVPIRFEGAWAQREVYCGREIVKGLDLELFVKTPEEVTIGRPATTVPSRHMTFGRARFCFDHATLGVHSVSAAYSVISLSLTAGREPHAHGERPIPAHGVSRSLRLFGTRVLV